MTDSQIEDRLAVDEDPRKHSDLWYRYEHADEQLAIERAKLREITERSNHNEHEDE